MVLAEHRGRLGRALHRSRASTTPSRGWCSSAARPSSACGGAESAMGPFYCPNDQTVYLDTDFFRVMEQQMGAQGEFAARLRHRPRGRPSRPERARHARRRSTPQRSRVERARVERAVGADRAAGRLLRRAVGARRARASTTLTDAGHQRRARHRRADRRRRAAAGGARAWWCPTASPTARASSASAGSTPATRPAIRRPATPSRRGAAVSEVVNLRTARKRAAREAERKAAAENAARHGRCQGRAARAEAERAKADGASRRPPARRRGRDALGRPVKRSLTLRGHRTSVSLEEPFWRAFREIAAAEGRPINALAAEIDAARGVETRPRLGDPAACAGLAPRRKGSRVTCVIHAAYRVDITRQSKPSLT